MVISNLDIFQTVEMMGDYVSEDIKRKVNNLDVALGPRGGEVWPFMRHPNTGWKPRSRMRPVFETTFSRRMPGI